MEESKYLKIFGTHADYIAYVNGDGKIFPNVSYCVNNNDIHYNPYGKIVSKFYASPNNITHFIYIDDFPDNVCEMFYDGDMVAFKQDIIQNYQNSKKYVYTGEMLEYGNDQYYLWEYEPKDEREQKDEVKYLITDTLDFIGKSLVENINNNYVPFIARLSSDKQTTYELGTDTDVPILIYSKSGLKIVDDIDYVSEIEIDGEKLPNVIQYLQIEDGEEHNISITFKNTSRIGDYCFYQCKGLQSIEIPKTVKIIGDAAFKESGLTGNLIIPNTVTQIGEDAFNGCIGLTSLQIGTGVWSIPDGTFQGCSGLTGTLVIPDNVESIGDYAFGGCSSLTGLEIGKGLFSLGPDPFVGCVSLETIVIDENNKWLDSRDNCNAIIEVDTSDIATLRVGSKNTVIPNTINEIGDEAFAGLPITSITIPSNITEIQYGAFRECSQLASVTVEATTPPRLLQDVFRNNASGRKIYVPSASVNAYKTASGWSDYAADIEAIQ